jgi:lysophospholipase L1-like esterase
MAVVFAACSPQDVQDCASEAAGMAEGELEASQEEPETARVYIALGDSISAGYGIHSPAYRYSSVLFEMLRYDGFVNEYVNMATDGFTTTMLLQRLNNMSAHNLELFQNAVIVTVNIGGNNIMQPFLNYLPDAEEVPVILSETLDFIQEVQETINQFMDFYAESRETIVEILDFATDIMDVVNNFNIADVLRFREFIDRASVIDDAAILFDDFTAIESEAADILERVSDLQLISTLSILTGSFSPELEAQLEEGVRIFAYEFAEIITWLKYNAPDALIIVNTVYNPIPEDISGIYLEISANAHVLIQEINQTSLEQSESGAFIVSDIYSILSNELALMNFNLDFVHPNPAGHSLIAQRNFEDFLSHR